MFQKIKVKEKKKKNFSCWSVYLLLSVLDRARSLHKAANPRKKIALPHHHGMSSPPPNGAKCNPLNFATMTVVRAKTV